MDIWSQHDQHVVPSEMCQMMWSGVCPSVAHASATAAYAVALALSPVAVVPCSGHVVTMYSVIAQSSIVSVCVNSNVSHCS
jgi:Na+-translocating ferredoxin:NAD+ oxidoreductase RnfE subunit